LLHSYRYLIFRQNSDAASILQRTDLKSPAELIHSDPWLQVELTVNLTGGKQGLPNAQDINFEAIAT